jgi:hypothetical protein
VVAGAVRARREPSGDDLGSGTEELTDRLVDLELTRTTGQVSVEEYERLRGRLLRRAGDVGHKES